MALINQPSILPMAFAAQGDKNTIPATGDLTSGLASIAQGFPPITQQPLAQGGLPPQRADFNGIFNLFSQFLLFAQNGGVYAYNNTLDYQPPAIIYHEGKFYSCLAENGPSTSAGAQKPPASSYWERLIPEVSPSTIVDMVYPVGSIYMSTASTNPGSLFGGTWEAYAQGRVLIGAGTGTDSRSEQKTFAAGSTGGEYNHQLTVGELASHNHSASAARNGAHTHVWYTGQYGSDNDSAATDAQGAGNHYSQHVTQSAGAHTHSVSISNTGSNAAHNNMQPYLTVYIWRRTA